MQFVIKIIISAIVLAGVAELGKRYSVFAAILAALPLTSILAMTLLYYDTSDSAKVAELSTGIFWAVLPTLVFFLALPLFLKNGFQFGISMLLSVGLMVGAYTVYVWALRRFGVLI